MDEINVTTENTEEMYTTESAKELYNTEINGFKFESDKYNSIHITNAEGKLIDMIDVEFTYKEKIFKELCEEWVSENKNTYK